jgi:hypothetical protein
MDISFAYFGVRMKEICTRYHVGMVGPTPGHVLSHRSPCVHDTSSIQGNTPSTNQEPVHVSKGPLPHGNGLKTPHTPPYPPSSHPDERRRKRNRLGIGRHSRLTNPNVRRFAPIFCVSSPLWILRAFPGCLGVFSRSDPGL